MRCSSSARTCTSLGSPRSPLALFAGRGRGRHAARAHHGLGAARPRSVLSHGGWAGEGGPGRGGEAAARRWGRRPGGGGGSGKRDARVRRCARAPARDDCEPQAAGRAPSRTRPVLTRAYPQLDSHLCVASQVLGLFPPGKAGPGEAVAGRVRAALAAAGVFDIEALQGCAVRTMVSLIPPHSRSHRRFPSLTMQYSWSSWFKLWAHLVRGAGHAWRAADGGGRALRGVHRPRVARSARRQGGFRLARLPTRVPA
jgi:hypothetical protein